jgi:hypothetical protein
MAPRVHPHPEARHKEDDPLREHSVDPATRNGDPFAFASEARDHPHACIGGLVFLTYVAYDEEIGDEAERIEVLPCRRCREAGRP